MAPKKQRLFSRLLKIKALADQSPVEAERSAASARLEAALARHGVSAAELNAYAQSMHRPHPQPVAGPGFGFGFGFGHVVIFVNHPGGFGFGFGADGATTTSGWTTTGNV